MSSKGTRWYKAGRPVSYTELPRGEHGLGAGKGADWAAWLAAFETWLKESSLSVDPVTVPRK